MTVWQCQYDTGLTSNRDKISPKYGYWVFSDREIEGWDCYMVGPVHDHVTKRVGWGTFSGNILHLETEDNNWGFAIIAEEAHAFATLARLGINPYEKAESS